MNQKLNWSIHKVKTKLCAASEISTGEVKRFEVDDKPVALVHTEDGGFHAVNDTCSHGDISLSEGFVEGCSLECIGHGSQFDLTTGEPLSLPAYEPIEVYKVEVIADEVFVDTDTLLNKKEFKA
ncbi:MAG: non-heme iron oxygenase ferredoxin subunit [Micrococcaceae bacterium]